jgi:hypothetical protein
MALTAARQLGRRSALAPSLLVAWNSDSHNQYYGKLDDLCTQRQMDGAAHSAEEGAWRARSARIFSERIFLF